MVAARRIQNAPVTLTVCVVRNALDGSELLTFQRALPYAFNAEDFDESWRMRGWKTVASQTPLQGFVFTGNASDVAVIQHPMPADIPRNAWAPRFETTSGWRKWYKEFRRFSRSFPETPLLGTTSQRDVIPFILQAFAQERRRAAIEARGDEEWPKTISGCRRRSRRLWPGAMHGAVKRTGQPFKHIVAFFEHWKATYFGVLIYIDEKIEDKPYTSYFP